MSTENGVAKPKLDVLLQNKLSTGTISHTEIKRCCIHAYGTVPKTNSDKKIMLLRIVVDHLVNRLMTM